MNLVYSALLLHSAGKELNEANIQKVADATGEKVEAAQVKALVAALDGVDIKSAIEKAAAPVAVAAPAPSGGEAKPDKKDDKKKEEDAEKAAEGAAAGLSSLFG